MDIRDAKRNRGFSLIELLFVIVIISIIASLAIPYIQRVKMTAQENSAVATLRTMAEGQALYVTLFQGYGTISELVAEEIVDNSLLGDKSGYQYSDSMVSQFHFEIVAVPIVPGISGDKGFYIDESGVIRYSTDGSAPNSSSPPI